MAAFSDVSRRDDLPPAPRRWLMGVELVVGIGALFGGYGLLKDAEGLGMRESWLKGSPFTTYRVPGLFLFAVIGGGMLAAALLTWRRSPLARPAATLMGVTLLAWLAIETAIIGLRAWQQYVLLALMGVCGALLIWKSRK